MEPEKIIKRNAFVAVCEYASNMQWCWNAMCTTCGHMDFRRAFSMLAKGMHPDDEGFWKISRDGSRRKLIEGDFDDFWSDRDKPGQKEKQIALAKIVSEARMADVSSVARFPDWLGYYGLVLNHCNCEEASKILSESLYPQILEFVERNTSLKEYFNRQIEIGARVSWNDLEILEREGVGHRLSDFSQY